MKKNFVVGFFVLLVMAAFVSSYSGEGVSTEFKNGRSFGTPFPFEEGTLEVNEFIEADSNNDGVVTGQEICIAHDMECLYSQNTAYNMNSNQGNIAEIAGATLGCYGGENYEYYYVGGELENRGFVTKCVNDEELAEEFREGELLTINSLGESSDSNGDGVTTGMEACETVDEYCVYTQIIAKNVAVGNQFMEVGGPTIGCYGGNNYESSQLDTLVKCVNNQDLSNVFVGGNVLFTPLPFAQGDENTEEFIEADFNADGVTTGDEFCSSKNLFCAYTQRITWNFDFGEGFIEAAEPTYGCYGGENHEYYYQGNELENRGVAVRCLSSDLGENGYGEEIGMSECLEISTNYWDQETNKCYGGYSDSIIESSCSDPDGGVNTFEEAHTFGFRSYFASDQDKRIRTGGKDSCLTGTTLREYYCSEEGYITSVNLECEFGCEEGFCIGNEVDIEIGDEPIVIPKSVKETQTAYVCNSGCELGEICYPLGHRKDTKYCSDELVFLQQLETDNLCENNFECSSNVCVSGECVSQGLLQKILAWFKRLL
jgi:hypothetical protein